MQSTITGEKSNQISKLCEQKLLKEIKINSNRTKPNAPERTRGSLRLHTREYIAWQRHNLRYIVEVNIWHKAE